MQETWVRSLGCEDPLEKEIATHSRILAWEIPWTEEPGGVQFMGSQNSWTQLRDLHTTTTIMRTKNITYTHTNTEPINQQTLKEGLRVVGQSSKTLVYLPGGEGRQTGY